MTKPDLIHLTPWPIADRHRKLELRATLRRHAENRKIHIAGYMLDISDKIQHSPAMRPMPEIQRDRAVQLLRDRGVARMRELAAAGVTATTVTRMKKAGEMIQLGRGLYQLPDAPASAHHDLAVVAKAVPTGVICLVSALAFHELTDVIPARVWTAIGPKDRKPNLEYPALQIVRFSDEHLAHGIKRHKIDGVAVSITTPTRTIVDLFRYRQAQGRRFKASPGLNIALEGLREGLRQRKSTPAEIARSAEQAGVWSVVRPYLEAMTANA